MNLNKEDPSKAQLLVDIPSLFHGAGSSQQIDCNWGATHIKTTYSSVKQLTGPLVVEAIGEKITVSGSLELNWTGPCRRCLEEASGTSEIKVSEIFEHDSTEGETFELPITETLDLRVMLEELALLHLPLAPLCSQACQGPEESNFDLQSQLDGVGNSKIDSVKDPRWAVLDELTFDDT